MHILAAARFTNWHYDSENHKTGKDSKYSKNMLVPYLGITYDLTPKHSVYASYTTIDKPQTVRDMNNNLLKPITGTNYEIGWKADWFGNGELNTALSLFRIEQKNRPYDLDTRNSAGEWAYLAQGKIRSQGIDAEISGSLTPDWMNRPKIIGGRMDWIRQLCLIRLFGDSTPLQILLAECSRWNSTGGVG